MKLLRIVLSVLALLALNAQSLADCTGLSVCFGVIRWDAAWYHGAGGGPDKNTDLRPYIECILGPARWQFRAPSFATVTGPNTIVIDQQGNNQQTIDQELIAAHAMGVRYMAFDWYPNTDGSALPNGYNNAWGWYQTSQYNSLVQWALIYQSSAGNPTAQMAMNAQFVAYMQQSTYLKVLSGRPVFFWLAGTSIDSTYAPVVADLRAKAIAAGLATPYIVMLVGQNSGTTAVTVATAVGADAISGYGIFDNGTPAQYISYQQAQWTNYATPAANAGLSYVLNMQTGSDNRPRYQCPDVHQTSPPWSTTSYWVGYGYPNPVGSSPLANSDIVTLVQDAMTFVTSNPSVETSKLILAYSWTECSEGGNCLRGTIGDPPDATSPYMNSKEKALSEVLP
jgi:hypothetical protein